MLTIYIAATSLDTLPVIQTKSWKLAKAGTLRTYTEDVADAIRQWFREYEGADADIDGGALDVLEVTGKPGEAVYLTVHGIRHAVVVRS